MERVSPSFCSCPSCKHNLRLCSGISYFFTFSSVHISDVPQSHFTQAFSARLSIWEHSCPQTVISLRAKTVLCSSLWALETLPCPWQSWVLINTSQVPWGFLWWTYNQISAWFPVWNTTLGSTPAVSLSHSYDLSSNNSTDDLAAVRLQNSNSKENSNQNLSPGKSSGRLP